MADKNLVQQIDRISYAIAAVVGVALLILPVLSGGDLARTRDDLNDTTAELARKKQEQLFPPLPERNLEDQIKAQWRPGSVGDSPAWVSGATPCLVKRAKSIKRRPAVHGKGSITEISAHRDRERQQVYLVVKGAMGANEFVVIESVQLSRREGTGEFKPVGRFDGAFEYRDDKVRPGEVYAYKFTTVASRDPAAPPNILPPEDTEQESDELETPPIPYDFSVKVRQTIASKELGELPTVMAEFYYWDYAKDARAGGRGTYKEKAELGKRYEIQRVDPDKRTITVKDNRWSTRYDIASKDQPNPLELWAPVSAPAEEPAEAAEEAPSAAEEAPSAAEEAPSAAEESSAEPEPAVEEATPEPADTPSRRPTRGRRGF